MVLWKVFRQVTDPVLGAVRFVTPAMVPERVVILFRRALDARAAHRPFPRHARHGRDPRSPVVNAMDDRSEIKDVEDREGVMRQDGLVVGIVGAGLINGMHSSPFFDQAFILMRPFAPTFFLSPVLLFYFTSLFLATLTIILAGVPAALYERYAGGGKSSPRSVMIWFIGVIVLSLPTIMTIAGMIG